MYNFTDGSICGTKQYSTSLPLDINCTDPLGRTALSIAIINENPELMEILLEAGIQVPVLGKFMMVLIFEQK